MNRVFIDKLSKEFFINGVGSASIASTTFIRSGNRFTVKNDKTNGYLCRNSNYTTFLKEDGTQFSSADEFENYLLDILDKGIYENRFYTTSSDVSKWQNNRTTQGLLNQQFNVFESYLITTFKPIITGVYKLHSNIIWSNNTTGDNFIAELNIIGNGLDKSIQFVSIESKDIGGNGAVLNVIANNTIVSNINTGTDIRNTANATDLITLEKGKDYTLTTKWKTQTSNDEGAIYSGLQYVELFKTIQ